MLMLCIHYDRIRKEIDILQNTNIIVMDNMKEAHKQLQGLLQMEVQRMTSLTTSKDQELVKENSKLKVEIATLRKQLQDKELA